MAAEARISQGPMKARTCPVCRARVDAITEVNVAGPATAVPKPGDFNICAYCGALTVFTEGGFRIPTFEECEQLDPQLLKLARPFLRIAPRES